LTRQKISMEGSCGVEVRKAFTELNNKRMQVAREEKTRTDKIDTDLLMVRDHCESQMLKQAKEEEVVSAKIEAAKARFRATTDMRKN
jgi:hypothetical protein